MKAVKWCREVFLFARWISIICGQLHDARLILRGKVILKIDFMVLLKYGLSSVARRSKNTLLSVQNTVQSNLKTGLYATNNLFVRNNKSNLFYLLLILIKVILCQ